jgi:hypothetical protein
MSKKVGAISTGEMVAIGLGAVAVIYFATSKSTVPTTTVIRTAAPTTTATTTAAEIAAGAGIVTSLINDFSDNS